MKTKMYFKVVERNSYLYCMYSFFFQVTSHPKKLMLPRTDARVGDQVPVVNPGEIQWQAGKFPAFILNFTLPLERFDEKIGTSIFQVRCACARTSKDWNSSFLALRQNYPKILTKTFLQKNSKKSSKKILQKRSSKKNPPKKSSKKILLKNPPKKILQKIHLRNSLKITKDFSNSIQLLWKDQTMEWNWKNLLLHIVLRWLREVANK